MCVYLRVGGLCRETSCPASLRVLLQDPIRNGFQHRSRLSLVSVHAARCLEEFTQSHCRGLAEWRAEDLFIWTPPARNNTLSCTQHTVPIP